MQRKRRRFARQPILSDDEDEDVPERPKRRRRVCQSDIRTFMPIRDDLAGMKKLRPSKEEERRLKQTQMPTYMTEKRPEARPPDEPDAPICSICTEPCDLFTTTNACTCPHHYECLIELSQHVEDAGDRNGMRPKCPLCRKPFTVVRRRDGTQRVRETIVAPEPQPAPQLAMMAARSQPRVTMVMPADGVWAQRRPPAFFATAPQMPGGVFDLATALMGGFAEAFGDVRTEADVLVRRHAPQRRRQRRRRTPTSYLPAVREKLQHRGFGEEMCAKIAERFDEKYTRPGDDVVALRKLRLLAALREDSVMNLDEMLQIVL